MKLGEIEPVDLDDRIDGVEVPLPDGVHRLSKEGRLAIWKIGVRQMTLAARFLKRGS